jgi:zinc transport system ATP-binding protein
MKKIAIEIKNLSFFYEKTAVLHDVNLIVEEGEFVGVFGPNGGGKTTLLKLLMGFLKPKQGSISLFGQPPQQGRSCVGYVPQSIRIDRQFPITVEEVVQMGCLSKLNPWGVLSSASKQKALQALSMVKMEDKQGSSFGSLSGGQMQRVLIARALVSDPKILFLDEPTASVDPAAECDILSLLSSLQKSMTIVMVTHDLQTIVQKTKKLLCVHRHVHALSPAEVCEHFGLGLYHSPLIKTSSFTKDSL